MNRNSKLPVVSDFKTRQNRQQTGAKSSTAATGPQTALKAKNFRHK